MKDMEKYRFAGEKEMLDYKENWVIHADVMYPLNRAREILWVTMNTMYYYKNTGKLSHCRSGYRHVYIPWDELVDFKSLKPVIWKPKNSLKTSEVESA